CKSWINESGSFSAQSNWQMYPVLFSQLFMPVPIETKEAIKRFMLESLLENGRSPAPNKAYPSVKAFLQANKSLSTAFINTILALAKDEMGHQKYNASYARKRHLVSGEEFVFEPNITPNLLGVDKKIAERRGRPFPSDKEAIIEKYLCREEPYNEPIISLDDYSVSILTATLDCGSGLDDPIVAKVASMILGYFFEVHASPVTNNSYHLFDAYKQETLRSLLQSELMQGGLASERAFTLLFDRNLTVVPREVRDFYFDVFSYFSNEYFHAFKDKSRRALLSRLYRTLEKRIKEIGDECAQNELERCLVFAPPRFSNIDNLKNKECGYSFEDKEFLCELYGKYGWRHFKDMLTSLYRFHYKNLLPEVLVPLASAIQEAEDKIPGALRKEVLSDETGNEKYFLLQIASIALVDFEKKIKEDNELEEAFLTLLRKLVDFGFAEAAVMEDEFLIH
ncbi:MAG: hypothetical protein IJS52_01150, partial [Bacilli bacterium]|nr:hypothetical protein [Bacilli bacterium]